MPLPTLKFSDIFLIDVMYWSIVYHFLVTSGFAVWLISNAINMLKTKFSVLAL